MQMLVLLQFPGIFFIAANSHVVGMLKELVTNRAHMAYTVLFCCESPSKRDQPYGRTKLMPNCGREHGQFGGSVLSLPENSNAKLPGRTRGLGEQ